MPGQGHAFGPGGSVHGLIEIPTDRAGRREFVRQSVRELAELGIWSPADDDLGAEVSTTP